MKKLFAAGAVLLGLLLTGCVARSEYDALAQERETLQTQVTALSQELDGLKSDVAELQRYTKELVEENDELRTALDEAEKEAAAQQQKIDAFVKTVEELEAQNRATLPPLPSVPLLPGAEDVQNVMDAFSELLELATRPLNLH